MRQYRVEIPISALQIFSSSNEKRTKDVKFVLHPYKDVIECKPRKFYYSEVPTQTQFSFPAMMANTAEALLTKSRIEEKSVLSFASNER